MDRYGFDKWLRSSGLSSAGCSSRVSWASRVEREFDVDLDFIVQDDDMVLDIIEAIYTSNVLTDRQRANFPNSVRKYYEFKNSRCLGTLRENGRRK